jgi:hypothetical protein
VFEADFLTLLPAQRDVEKLGNYYFLEKMAVLQRFDLLTQDEARAVVAQTLEVAYRLVKSMKEAMDGARAWIYFLRMLTSVRSGGKAQDWRRSMTSAGTRYVQLVCVGSRD